VSHAGVDNGLSDLLGSYSGRGTGRLFDLEDLAGVGGDAVAAGAVVRGRYTRAQAFATISKCAAENPQRKPKARATDVFPVRKLKAAIVRRRAFSSASRNRPCSGTPRGRARQTTCGELLESPAGSAAGCSVIGECVSRSWRQLTVLMLA